MSLPENPSNLTDQLDHIQGELLAIAQHHQEDARALLTLLRDLECTHRKISETYFYPSLPDRRRELYNLLRDMETEGGWPYIMRPKLKFILANLLQAEGIELPEDLGGNR